MFYNGVVLFKCIEYLSLIGISFTLFLLVSFILKKENKRANIVLSIIFLLISLDLLTLLFEYGNMSISLTFLQKLMFSSMYFYASLITLYIRIQTGNKKISFKMWAVQITPPVTALILIIITSNRLHKFLLYIGYLYLLFNLALSYLRVRSFNKKIKEYFSSIKYIKQLWVRAVLLGAILVTATSLINDAYRAPTELIDKSSPLLTLLTLVFTVFFVLIIGLIAMNQPEITQRVEGLSPLYNNQKLGISEADRYKNKIFNLLENEKPYLDENLDLETLAAKLDIDKHRLSMILNTYIKINFYTLINNYRVEEAKKMLRDISLSKLTIIEIAYKSGFNSKATFYSHFNRVTGTTPTKYRKK